MNKLEKLKVLELMCESLIAVIKLHRMGVESYDDILLRVSWLNKYIEGILKEK